MEEEIDIKEILLQIWKSKLFIILVAVIFIVIGLARYELKKDTPIKQKDTYIAEITFMPGNIEVKNKNITKEINEDGNEITLENESFYTNTVTIDNNLITTYKEIIFSESIINIINEELQLNLNRNEVKKIINLERIDESNVLKLSVNYNDKTKTDRIINIVIDELQLKLNELYNMTELRVIDSFEAKDSIKESIEDNNIKVNIKSVLKFAVLGFIVSCGMVVLYELFNDSVKNENQLEKILNLKNLVKIKYDNDDSNENIFRILRVNINECKNILVTSSDGKTGKTYVSTKLAKSFAKLNKKVVLIDLVNVDNSLILKNNGKGLSDYLNSDDKFIEKYVKETSEKNLGVLTIGGELNNFTELLENTKMIETMKTLERLYDVIIIDSENVLESANTLAMSKIVKFTLLVVEARKSKLENVIKAKNNIEDVGGNVIGTVFNKVK